MGSEKAPWHLTCRSEFAKQRWVDRQAEDSPINTQQTSCPKPLCLGRFRKAHKKTRPPKVRNL